jgi:F-type H+-transporting ATPase subunit b
MELLSDIGSALVIAQEGGGAEEEGGGSFLVSPNVGLMIWTLLAFGLTLYLLNKYAFPRITDALDRRRRAIEESIDSADRTRQEAEQLLEEYRARLRQAREQAEDIVARSRKAAERFEDESKERANKERDELMARTRREIEAETRRALDEIRKEVADLTVLATERITRKALDPDDQRRLVQEALEEVDFSALAGEPARGGNGGGPGEPASREG